MGFHTLEDKGAFINAGEQILNYTFFRGEHKVYFAKLGYDDKKYQASIEYIHNKAKNGVEKYFGIGFDDLKAKELILRAGYKYNDKLSLNAWYSWAKWQGGLNSQILDHSTKNDFSYKSKKFRLEARYNF